MSWIGDTSTILRLLIYMAGGIIRLLLQRAEVVSPANYFIIVCFSVGLYVIVMKLIRWIIGAVTGIITSLVMIKIVLPVLVPLALERIR